MPKIADEFRAERPAPSLESTTVKTPKPIAKPAPMAPRNVAPKVAAPMNAARPVQDGPQSALAEKLRAQREAAERLAAQRVTAARERAENRNSPEPKLPVTPQGTKNTIPPGRPKFSFADEPAPPAFQPKQPSNSIPPLLPPRPALGGDRPPGFSARGAGYAPQNGGYRQEPPASFRPIDPATGYPGRQTAGQIPRGFAPPGGNTAPALPAGRRQAPPPVSDDRYHVEEEDFRSDPRLTRSMARQHQPVGDVGDDVFDEPAPPASVRRRASAAEYNAAYREAEEGYAEPGRRSGGPWLLLFALLLAAVATGGIVWYYQTKIKPVASVGSGITTESVPVVAAPVEPVKTAAETPAEQPTVVEPANKKQIYDRIVGDQEILGDAQLVPSEQIPIQPEATTGSQDAQTGSELIPVPAGTQGTDDAEPLSLPPPPGESGTNTQGSLDSTQAQPVATETAAKDASAETIGSLVEKSATDTSAAVETPSASGSDSIAAAPEQVPQLETVGEEPVAEAPEVKKPAVAAKKVAAKPAKKPAKAKPAETAGDEPVVLVPPSQGTETTVEAIDIGGGTAAGQNGVVAGDAVTAPKKKKTIFDLFKAKNATTGDVAAPAQQQETQVASNTAAPDETVATNKTTPPAAKTAGGAGFVAQLASFRSQGEAQAEFNRLQGKYPEALGGKQANISTATVAGSTRYRLGVGPMASRDEAQKVCGSLLANGERDCLVRKQ